MPAGNSNAAGRLRGIGSLVIILDRRRRIGSARHVLVYTITLVITVIFTA
jgi:hypothetical protein